jgi:HEAT repeat protein
MALVKGRTAPTVEQARLKEASCDELEDQLASPDPSVRRHAAQEILRCPNAGTALVSSLRREQEVAVRGAILTALIRLDDPAATVGLADCLRSEDVALRNEAIEALRELASSGDGTGTIPPVLASLLADPDPDVRIFAVNVMEAVTRLEVERWLIEVIEKDPHINVCSTAVDLLCEVGTEAALDPLVRLKARFPSEPYIQFAADLALKRIREI